MDANVTVTIPRLAALNLCDLAETRIAELNALSERFPGSDGDHSIRNSYERAIEQMLSVLENTR